MPIAWPDLPTPLVLPDLFLCTVLCRGIRGKALPERSLCSQVTMDPKHLERYHQVCGFRNDGPLPPTHPHVLTLPLQTALLTNKRFPLPLLGLVYLENRIDVLRALGDLGPSTMSAAVENLQPHDKGAIFSIVTRLEDQLGPLWVDDSRALCRGVKVPGEIPPKTEQEPLPLEPVDNWKTSTDIGRRYARTAGGYNPIYLSAPSAKSFGLPRAIAHNLWNKVRSLAALSKRLSVLDHRVEVYFQKSMLPLVSLTLPVSVAAADDQFSLHGKGDLPYMAGRWSRLQD